MTTKYDPRDLISGLPIKVGWAFGRYHTWDIYDFLLRGARKMIYVVNVDIEVEAESKEAAEDLVIDNLAEFATDFYSMVREVKELNA